MTSETTTARVQAGTGVDRTASEVLAAFVADLHFEALPPGVVNRATHLLLDTLGVALSNVSRGPSGIMRSVIEETRGAEVSRIWGTSNSTTPPMAALANGLASHLSDFDDTHAEAGLHASATIVPAVLAVADARGLDGRSIITALVSGYEVACRLGAAAPHVFTLKKWHATSTCGTIAAAVAAGKSLNLTPEQLTAAMGIAVSMASGTLQPLEEGSPVKAMHPGWAAHSGVWAALMAEKGFPGPKASLDGRQGFFNAFIGEGSWSEDRITRGLGAEWETTKVISKPYACCHFLHALVDAASLYRADHPADGIAEVRCQVPREARDVVCEPWAEKQAPASAYAARFSLPFVVASALRNGGLSEDDFADEAMEATIHGDLIKRVSYAFDGDSRLAETYGGELVITTLAGTEWRHRVVHPSGSAAAPLTEADLHRKFRRSARGALDEKSCEILLGQISSIDVLSSSGDLALTGTIPSTRMESQDD